MRDLWQFLKTHKRWWLVPLITIAVLVGVLLMLARRADVAPFVYSVF